MIVILRSSIVCTAYGKNEDYEKSLGFHHQNEDYGKSLGVFHKNRLGIYAPPRCVKAALLQDGSGASVR